MYRKLLLIGSAVALFALPGMAQSSQLSGTWKLNASKSEMGPMGGGGSETDVITVGGTEFTQKVTSESPRGTQKYTRACTVNGQEEKLSPDNPRAHIGPVVISSIKCAKEGDSVVVTEGFDMRGTPSTDQMTFTPSNDGNTLTMSRQISGAMSMQQKMVFDREGSASSDPPAANGEHPNLSGTWDLDVAKSKFGQGQAPTSEVDTITESGDAMKVVSAQKGGMMGDMNTTETFTTDGKPSNWSGMGDSKVTGTATWEGSKLAVNAKTDFQGSPVTITETYSLSSDGKTLTHVVHAQTSMGNFDSTSVYEKQ